MILGAVCILKQSANTETVLKSITRHFLPVQHYVVKTVL